MSNVSRTLYVGAASDLERRAQQHKRDRRPGFTR
jgi:predicted GIY-YIG superfamily endonuclease